MSKEQLIKMARENIEHAKHGTVTLADDVYEVPAANYFDQTRFEQEIDDVFKRVPLMLAPTAELPKNGDYKSMEAVGVPVLLTRGADGVVRSFINSCTHRGTNVVISECGNAKRFTCPYHGWTFDREGKLVAVASREEFGNIDTDDYGLKELPTLERAGLIWAILDPDSTLEIEPFLSGYDELLAEFGFDDWHLFQKRTVRGPNWKIAYDGYLDLYHLPVLHRDTFGADMSNQALYHAWGPHQRVTSPSRHMISLEDVPEDQWDMTTLMMGVWTIFPHISIASFMGGGRSVMISQLFPGDTPGESFTTQYYLMESEPTEAEIIEAERQFKLLEYVVETEDYGTGLRQQRALEAGGLDKVLFGRNEGGGQTFHGWVQRILDTDDDDINDLFRGANQRAAAE
ncbi:MAG: aromatic ring-hydroxylating oxygenase subunit alpha [Alphaproteobacteria bacterium]